MKQFIKPFIVLFVFLFTIQVYGQDHSKYPAFETFYDTSYNNLTNTEADYLPLFKAALKEAEQLPDLFERNLRCAWANYIMSRAYYELNELDLSEQYCDLAEAQAMEARNINENEESLLIYICCVGQNCQMKPFSYLASNGLSVGQIAKKIVKLNPKNGHALFLASSQDVYGPAPFNNIKRGTKTMLEIMNDKTLIMNNQVLFDVYCAEAFCLIHSGMPTEAQQYLNMAARIFPNNLTLERLRSSIN